VACCRARVLGREAKNCQYFFPKIATGYRNVFSVTSARAARRGNPASPGRANWTDLHRKASAFECANPRGKRCHIAQARGAGVRARPPASFRQCRRRGRETRQPRIAWARRLNRSSKNIKCFRMRQSPWQTVPHGSSVGGGSEGTPAGGLTKLDTYKADTQRDVFSRRLVAH
jgi:hypothetical protein